MTKFVARFVTGVTHYVNIDVQPVGYVVYSKACRIEDYEVFNTTAGILYLKLYDKGDTVPDAAVDKPVKVLLVPSQSGANLADLNWPFTNGLAIRGTTGVLDTDTGAPAANGLIVNIGHKPT